MNNAFVISASLPWLKPKYSIADFDGRNVPVLLEDLLLSLTAVIEGIMLVPEGSSGPIVIAGVPSLDVMYPGRLRCKNFVRRRRSVECSHVFGLFAQLSSCWP
jgi:hypothetical protein